MSSLGGAFGLSRLGRRVGLRSRALPFSVHRVRGQNGNFISRIRRKCLSCSNVREFRCHDRSTSREVELYGKHFLCLTVNRERCRANISLSPGAEKSLTRTCTDYSDGASLCVCFICVCAPLFHQSCHERPPRSMCVKLVPCVFSDVCDSVRVSLSIRCGLLQLFSMKPAMYLTGVIDAGTSRSVLWAPLFATAIANVRHTSILYMSQYI